MAQKDRLDGLQSQVKELKDAHKHRVKAKYIIWGLELILLDGRDQGCEEKLYSTRIHSRNIPSRSPSISHYPVTGYYSFCLEF